MYENTIILYSWLKRLSENLVLNFITWCITTVYLIVHSKINVKKKTKKKQLLCEQQWHLQSFWGRDRIPQRRSVAALSTIRGSLFSDSSHVLAVNRLINCTFCNSIKGSVMVHKVWNSVDPWGDPQSLDNYPTFLQNCLWRSVKDYYVSSLWRCSW